ncbi:MAG: NAD-dependent epimerase/dehydratase family protein [Anaerolineae bacterium]|nr:NAD-dependent epimerase/dehydratase family protein [Anaerolineae bacterium]
MKILLVGGTRFVGRHLVDVALARGHTITLFNRGKSNADLFPNIEQIRGDRANADDLALLQSQTWDAVIDTCGYAPNIVRLSAQALKDYTKHYTFISSISVYAETRVAGITEDHPVGTLSEEAANAIQKNEEVTGETYGPAKALCEQEVLRAFPNSALVIRPGLIVGPNDVTDRFTYWPVRVAQGGAVLAPGSPDWVTQVIDVRDLAEWTISRVEVQQTGIYQATGPAHELTFGELLLTCQQASNAQSKLVWVDEQWLLDQNVAPWSDLPMWIPTTDPDYVGFSRMNCAKAIAAGLHFRPIAETVRDTLTWHATRGVTELKAGLKAGLKAEREDELLAKWAER